jgi:hypothetical protein
VVKYAANTSFSLVSNESAKEAKLYSSLFHGSSQLLVLVIRIVFLVVLASIGGIIFVYFVFAT